MKSFIIVLSALASTASFAINRPALYCVAENAHPDFGYELQLDWVGPTPVGGAVYVAKLSSQSIAGPQLVANFKGIIQHPRDPRLMGGATIFKGKNFDLELGTDTAPRPNGFRSNLTVEVKGRRISEVMDCRYVR